MINVPIITPPPPSPNDAACYRNEEIPVQSLTIMFFRSRIIERMDPATAGTWQNLLVTSTWGTERVFSVKRINWQRPIAFCYRLFGSTIPPHFSYHGVPRYRFSLTLSPLLVEGCLPLLMGKGGKEPNKTTPKYCGHLPVYFISFFLSRLLYILISSNPVLYRYLYLIGEYHEK